MKKSIIFMAVIMLLQSICFAENYTQIFYDVPKEHWAFEQIAELVNRGVINGYEDGSYKPNKTINRAEWATIMIKAANKNLEEEKSSFSDMQGHWANIFVNAARQYMTSYANGTEFRPDIAALREDVTVAMVKLKGYSVNNADFSYIANFKDQDSISANCKKYVAIAVEKGLISGFEDNTFRGQDTLTRAEAAMLLWRAFQKGNDDKVIEETQAQNNSVQTETTQKPDMLQQTVEMEEQILDTISKDEDEMEYDFEEKTFGEDKNDIEQEMKQHILDTENPTSMDKNKYDWLDQMGYADYEYSAIGNSFSAISEGTRASDGKKYDRGLKFVLYDYTSGMWGNGGTIENKDGIMVCYQNISYLLNSNYISFMGTIAFIGDEYDKGNSVIRVYGDDNLIYTSPIISYGTKSTEFNIDTKDVKILKISVEFLNASGGRVNAYPCIADARLEKK